MSEPGSLWTSLVRLTADWMTVYRWNPRLYRRVAISGFVLGFLAALLIAATTLCVLWIASQS